VTRQTAWLTKRRLPLVLLLVQVWPWAAAAGVDDIKVSVLLSGVTIRPQMTGGELSAPSQPDSRVGLGNASSLAGGLALDGDGPWRLAVFGLARPFEHEVRGAGALAGVGKLGSVKLLPITALAQYRLGSGWDAFGLQPYLGVGATYAYVYKTSSAPSLTALTQPGGSAETSIRVGSRWGLDLQVGLRAQVDARWSIDASLLRTRLRMQAQVSTGQTTALRVDPCIGMLSLGYRFP
jgi:outer membrane protein